MSHILKDSTRKFFIFLTFLLISLIGAQQKKFILVLDAGHGGYDHGAKGLIKDEKQINLEIVLKIGELIEKNLTDVQVIYTRNTDEFIPLLERASIANRNKADFFISIHCNSSKNRAPYGTETFVLGTHRNKDNFEVAKRENEVIYLEKDYKTTYEGFNPSSPESIIGLTLLQNTYLENSLLMAQSVENNFIKNKRYSRGVKQQGFLVLVQTSMPSILVETGFVSNIQEGAFLASEEGQMSVAQDIFDAFVTYKKVYDVRSGKISSGTQSNEGILEQPLNYTIKIQFLDSPTRFDVGSPELLGIQNFEITKYNGRYYYFTTPTNFVSVANKNLQEMQQVGFKDAKQVEFGKEPLQEAKFSYTIELLNSFKRYRENDPIFFGLKSVRRVKQPNKTFSYLLGNLSTYDDAKKLLESVKTLGLKNAIIQKNDL